MINPFIINDLHCMRLKDTYFSLLQETEKIKHISGLKLTTYNEKYSVNVRYE